MGECWEALQNVCQLAISGLSEASDAQKPPSRAASFNGSKTSGYAAILDHGKLRIRDVDRDDRCQQTLLGTSTPRFRPRHPMICNTGPTRRYDARSAAQGSSGTPPLPYNMGPQQDMDGACKEDSDCNRGAPSAGRKLSEPESTAAAPLTAPALQPASAPQAASAPQLASMPLLEWIRQDSPTMANFASATSTEMTHARKQLLGTRTARFRPGRKR